MNKQIAILALEHLWNNLDYAKEIYFSDNDKSHYEVNDVEIEGKIFILPDDGELSVLLKRHRNRTNGGLRTKQILILALNYYLNDIDDEQTESVIKSNLEEIDELAARFPKLETKIKWDIFSPTDENYREWTDSVYFEGTMGTVEVYKSLVEHDGYDVGIKLVPKIV